MNRPMSRRGRVLLASACGLVLAGIVHIVTVLMIPHFAERSALELTRSSESLDHPQRIHALARNAGTDPGTDPQAWLPAPDPAVAVGVCGYDLAAGPMRVSAPTSVLNLSVAVHGERGAFYAVTDQAAVRGALEMVVMTRAQYDQALADDGEDASRDVRVIAPDRRGFAVVRVIAALPSQRVQADKAVDAVACSTLASEDGAEVPTKPAAP